MKVSKWLKRWIHQLVRAEKSGKLCCL